MVRWYSWRGSPGRHPALSSYLSQFPDILLLDFVLVITGADLLLAALARFSRDILQGLFRAELPAIST
jgi:hypothetical protein